MRITQEICKIKPPTYFHMLKEEPSRFPGGAVVESPPPDAGDTGSCPGPGRAVGPVNHGR